MIRQAFGEESMSSIWAVQTHRDRKRRDRRRAKSRACSSFSLTSNGLFTNNSSWHTKQSVPNTSVMFYGDCVKMWENLVPNYGDKRTDCCIMTTHRLTLSFSPGNFWPKTTWLSSPIQHTFLFPRVKIKLKSSHFDTNEVIKAESHAVLNTLTTSRMHLKMTKSLGTVHTRGRILLVLRGWRWPVGLKLIFWPDGNTSPGDYGRLLVDVSKLKLKLKLNSMVWVRERTIPTEL
jgi:hypothetical protein